MTIHSLNEYAKSKVVVKDLEKALKIIKATEASLTKYKFYKPVFFILTTISNERKMLEMLLEYHKIIFQTKGEKRAQ